MRRRFPFLRRWVKGVVPAFETMGTEFMNTVQKAMCYVQRVNAPYLQVYPDLGNVINAILIYGTTVQDDLIAGRGPLAALHLKDGLPGEYREIPYRSGHVDVDAAIETAKPLGIRLFPAEFWDTGKADWPDQIRHAHDLLGSRL